MTRRRTPSSFWPALLVVGALILGVVLVGGWVVLRDQTSGWTPGAPATSAADASPRGHGSTRPLKPAALFPVRLEISAIDVATPLVRLGLESDRTVEVPTDADKAGWFQRGPLPGQQGSAVILGHVDSDQGPAVFARLQELQRGDTVMVERANGSTVQFVVRRSVLYANADFPADRVYAAQGDRRLNIVTCGGVYDSTRGGYQSNIVVYTTRNRDRASG